MGTFNFLRLPQINTETISLSRAVNWPAVTSTSTLLVLDEGRFFLRGEGSGFAYTFANGQIVDVVAGTITRIAFTTTASGGEVGTDWSDLNLSMARLADALFADDGPAFRNYLFSGADRVRGSTGADRLVSFAGDDTVFGKDLRDMLIGMIGDDDLFGGSGEDRVYGGADDDLLFGGSMSDALFGGAGDDILAGGATRDTLTGGAGHDAFVFDAPRWSGGQRDRITDFVASDDRIRLDDAIFTQIGALGRLDADRFLLGVAAQDAEDRIIYDKAEGVLSYDRDGRGGADAVMIAVLDAGTVLTRFDIIVF
jgi:Ca2+-binding RTX toxin-like protein